MSDIGLSGSITLDPAPALTGLESVESAAGDTAAAITELGDEGSVAISRLIASFAGLADSAEMAAVKISAGSSRIVAGMGGIDESTGKVKALNQTLGTTAAIITVTAGAAMASAASLDFMLAHTAANAGLSNQELAQMRAVILKLGSDTGQSFDGLAQGFMKIHNMGFAGADAVNILTVANKSAIGTGADVAGTAEVLAKALHEYGMQASQAGEAMNVMHLMSQRGNMTLEQFDSAMGITIGTAANLGVSLTDVSAAEAALTQHGFDAAEGSTQLKAIMDHMVAATPQSIEALKALGQATGIDLVDDFSKAGLTAKGLHGVFEDLGRALNLTRSDTDVLSEATKNGLIASMAKMNPASAEYAKDMDMLNAATGGHVDKIMKLIPAMRGGLGAMILLGTGAKDYATDLDYANEAMAGKIDPTTRDFNRTMGTAAQQWAILTRTIEADADAVGEKLLPTFLALTPALKDVAMAVLTGLDDFSKLPKPIQDVVFGIGTLTAVNFVLGGAIGKTGGAIIALIGELPVFTGATGGATEAEGAQTVTTNVLTASMARLTAAIGTASMSTVGLTVAGGADLTLEGAWAAGTTALTGAFVGLGASIAAIPGVVAGAAGSLTAWLATPLVLTAGTVGALIAGGAGIGDELYQTANYSEKASAETARGDALPDVSPFIDKQASLRQDERMHPGNRVKDEKQLIEIKNVLDKIFGVTQKHAELTPKHHLAMEHHGAAIPKDPFNSSNVPGKPKGEQGADAGTETINEAMQRMHDAIDSLNMPVPEILGKLISGSQAVAIAAKLMSGEIRNANVAQKAFIVGLAEADDRLTAGKAAIDGYDANIIDLRKNQTLGANATDAEKLAYDYHREGLLQTIPVLGTMTAAERKEVEAQNAHIEAVNKRISGDRQVILAMTQENAVSDILTAAKQKLAQATMTQFQSDMLAAAGSARMLSSLTAAQRATLSLTVTQTENANVVRAAYQSSLGVLDDYIRKAQEAGTAARGGSSYSQQAEASISNLKAQPGYDPTNAETQQKIRQTRTAAQALDDQAAIDDITKWGGAWQQTLGELSAKMAGTYSAGQAAFDAWKEENLQGLASVRIALGTNYQAWEDSVKAIIENTVSMTHLSDGVEDYRKKLADVQHEAQIMGATNPFAKWQLQQQTYDSSTGSYASPRGVSGQQEKSLFNLQQTQADIQTAGNDFQSVFQSAFEAAYKKGTQGFVITLGEGLRKTLVDWVAKFASTQVTGGLTGMLTKMSGAGHHNPAAPAGPETLEGLLQKQNTTALGVLTTTEKALTAALEKCTAALTGKTPGTGVKTPGATAGTSSGANILGDAQAGLGLFSQLTGSSAITSGASKIMGLLGGIPGFADGGDFDGSGPIMVGEDGPEILNPGSGGHVMSHSDTMSALSRRSAGGNVTHNHNTTIHVKTPDAGSFKASRQQIADEQSRAMARRRR